MRAGVRAGVRAGLRCGYALACVCGVGARRECAPLNIGRGAQPPFEEFNTSSSQSYIYTFYSPCSTHALNELMMRTRFQRLDFNWCSKLP